MVLKTTKQILTEKLRAACHRINRIAFESHTGLRTENDAAHETEKAEWQKKEIMTELKALQY